MRHCGSTTLPEVGRRGSGWKLDPARTACRRAYKPRRCRRSRAHNPTLIRPFNHSARLIDNAAPFCNSSQPICDPESRIKSCSARETRLEESGIVSDVPPPPERESTSSHWSEAEEPRSRPTLASPDIPPCQPQLRSALECDLSEEYLQAVVRASCLRLLIYSDVQDSDATIKIVYDWLKAAGIFRDRYQLSTSLSWL